VKGQGQRLAVFVALALSGGALAQDLPCDTRCNQQASECIKACAGDPKDASKAENAQRLIACLQKCEREAEPCRKQCKVKPTERPK
jgi:hypothetical protein